MKPILFNTENVRALLEDRKTVTRRVVKHNPCECESKQLNGVCKICDDKGGFFWPDEYVKARSPYQPGDILYVRETFRVDYLSNIPGTGRIQYKADGLFSDFSFEPGRYDMMRRAQLKPGWRPNENMPREAARIFLRVTGVRVERLQEIDDAQAYAEGAEGVPCNCDGSEFFCSRCCNTGWFIYPRSEFARIWDSTIKPADRALYGWTANPWVWVIEFERTDRP